MRIFLGLLLSLFIVHHGHSQLLTGIIKDATDQPLAGVTVYFLNTSNGTNTDQNGAFVLIRKNNETQLVIAYTGFRSDTLSIPKDQNFLKLQLNEGTSLNEVVIQSKRESTSFSLLNP
ncbi:MAG: carboxypeptidase-like regulatory domain-containing protein [Saprospiraceae bacterium]|nr:carboxypeptidase-like regulatory domain-containing protein [Saprospiraceae bacterium]